MDHDVDREVAGAVRALLVEAAGDPAPATDLLEEIRRRARRQRVRRRVLVPSLATLTGASMIAVAAMVASVVTGTGTPSAQARVAAAAGRTATEGYRVRIVTSDGGKPSAAGQTFEGVFDPARRTGRLLLQGQGLEVRFVDDMVYTELPAGSRPAGKRWAAERRGPEAGELPVFAQLTKFAWRDPQQALARLRSASAVREQGPVDGDGWSGTRFAFELPEQPIKRGIRMAGSVDVDRSGRVRRLEVTNRPAAAGPAAETFRVVMEFGHHGARVQVPAPPAGEVARAADLPAKGGSAAPEAKRAQAPDAKSAGAPEAKTERAEQP